MKPENILHCHVLDILFENRNKEYGAYELRRHYNRRLMQAIGITIMLIVLLFLLQGMRPKNSNLGQLRYIDTVKLTSVELEDDEPEKNTKEKQKPDPQARLHQQAITNDDPVIKPDAEVTEDVPTQDDLAEIRVADAPSDGPPGDPDIVAPREEGPTNVTHGTVSEPEVPAGPVEFADVMPTFNGDIVKYMLRHLRQPDDLEPGDRIVVRVKFVVNEEGSISDIKVLESGRADLDKEVVRVIRMMPRWNPGKQAGRPVPVFFKMPVTFVSHGD